MRVVSKDAIPEPAGSPVPLSADEVTTLVRGEMAEERIARILEAKPVPVGPSGKQGRKAKQAPVDFTEAELAAIAAGEVADKVRVRLEKAAAAGRLKVVDRRTGKPLLRPPGEAGRRRR